MAAQKVYIINDDPGQTASRKSETPVVSEPPAAATDARPATSPNADTRASIPAKGYGWLLAFRQYALGPLNLLLWPSGRGRKWWAIVGVVSLAAPALLWILSGAVIGALDRLEFGAVWWAVTVAFVTLVTTTAWARVVATSERGASWPRFLRRSAAVCALGLVLPGLGLLITGRRWKAAAAVWCAGLLVAALIVARQWRWLAASSIGGGGALSHQTIEGILFAASGCVAFACLAWLAFAFDGVRVVSPVSRSSSVANGLALVLLVTIVSLFATVRPVPIARDLGSAAEQLRHQGLRMIPLALYDVASMLDPATPSYLAGAATLCDQLGMSDKADAKRELLQRRAVQFADAVGAELIPVAAPETTLLWSDRSSDGIDHITRHDVLLTERDGAGLQSEQR